MNMVSGNTVGSILRRHLQSISFGEDLYIAFPRIRGKSALTLPLGPWRGHCAKCGADGERSLL